MHRSQIQTLFKNRSIGPLTPLWTLGQQLPCSGALTPTLPFTPPLPTKYAPPLITSSKFRCYLNFELSKSFKSCFISSFTSEGTRGQGVVFLCVPARWAINLCTPPVIIFSQNLHFRYLYPFFSPYVGTFCSSPYRQAGSVRDPLASILNFEAFGLLERI